MPVVVAVQQDPRGDAWDLTLAYAKALGALRAGAIRTTFKEETETDLFGEQNVLLGGVNKLVEMGFEVLTDAGYQPEIAYFEVCHELKMIVDLMNEGGLNKDRWSCSDTAQYGDYVNTCIDEHVRERMEYHLKRIQDGSFAKEFMGDQAAGAPKFKELQEKFSHEKIEEVAAYCVDIKRQVVEQDEHDTALRMILNYGHTLGHAIEKVTNHAVTHGHGVAMGMVLITRVGIKLGLCDRALLQRLTAVLTRYHLPTVYGGSVPALSNACLHDKKRAGSKIRLILVRQAGKAEIVPMEAQEFAALLADALPE